MAGAVAWVAAAALPGDARAASTNLLINGSFELGGPAGTYYPGDVAITGWHITHYGVDLMEFPDWQASDGVRSLDMSANDWGGVRQDLTGLTPGASYRVEFDLAANPDAQMDRALSTTVDNGVYNLFSITDVFDYTNQTPANMGWLTIFHDFVYQGAGNLSLSLVNGASGSPYGPALDNVRLYRIDQTTAVPLPPAAALFATALAGLAAVRLRRRQSGTA